jgi:hypothetical protein
MPTDRPSPLLTASAAISVVIALILCGGYFANFGPGWMRIVRSPVAKMQFIEAQLYRGGFGCYFGEAAPVMPGQVTGLQWRFRFAHLNTKRSLWQFEYYWLYGPGVRQGNIMFPIWCLLLPCLIAPIRWLRKRRRSQPMGFDVITTSK